MGNVLVLLAGYPATGKSYLCSLVLKRHLEFVVVSQDELKEALWDEFGFDDMEEKTALEMRAWDAYYARIDEGMRAGEALISDYPFSEKQRPTLERLSEEHGYRVLTVRLTGDIDVLYERSRSRDLDPSRHLGHLVSRYRKGDELEDRSKADCFVTPPVFRERCLTRGYDVFRLGELVEVDATDLSKVDYAPVLERIDALMGEGRR